MNYAEITMWLTVINSIIVVAGGYALCRYIRKQNSEPRPGSLDAMCKDWCHKNSKVLNRIIEKSKRGEKITPQDYEDD